MIFFTYISEELPEICKAAFNISPQPEDTFVMGVSMGGYGALKCALTYPDRYGACCAFSSGPLYLKDFMSEMYGHDHSGTPLPPWGEALIDDYRAAFGQDFEWSPDIDVSELAKTASPPKAPRFYSCCGKSDGLADINRRFARR
jgi:S-formylglutathione hydrolase FrmB